MRAAIVGGGIVGLASAYYLAERGVGVSVLEKGSLGGGATGRANGGIRAQFTAPVSVELSRESIEVWERFEAAFGVDIEYRRPGYLFLARTSETAERFRENVRVQNDLGVPSEFLAPTEAAEHCPGLRTDRYEAATYSPTDGFADPHLALQGFSQAATEAGAEIRTGVEVTGVLAATDEPDDRVAGVETTDGTVEADYVVNAAGAWGGRVAAMAGIDVPITPERHALLVTDPEQPVPESVPLTADLDDGVHFRPERDGRAVVGGYFGEETPRADPDRYDERASVEWAATTLEHAGDAATYFGPDSRVRRTWAGVYAVTPDHHPVIEETRPGLVNAVGFSGHGFMQAPATGQIVAEIVADGAPSLVDVSALAADRFQRGELIEEGTVID